MMEIKHVENVLLFLEKKSNARKEQNINTPARTNAALSCTHPNRVALTLKEERLKNKELKVRMAAEIQPKAIPVDTDLAADIDQIMENSDDISPFMKLFWEQQKEVSVKKSMRYHPMIIRFCSSLFSKSASAYEELRSSKILTLPSRRTLQDYKNAIKPSAGFNPGVINERKKLASQLKDHQGTCVFHLTK